MQDTTRTPTCSCCGYDDPVFGPEAHARRRFLQCVGLAAGTLAVGAAARTNPAYAQAGGPAPAVAQAPQAPVREISQIAGNLWRFRNNFHFSVFAVTRAGIIATDPINADASRWLKEQLAQRFPNQPIRYLIYSHDHADHISGGEVLGDGAVVVAHENAKAKIVGERRPTAVPQITFRDAMTIELGGTVVELVYAGRNHSDNSIVMRFPAERALFAVDFIPVESLAFRNLQDTYVEEWFDSLRRVEAMDFDILAPGHGPLGRKEHVRQFREYLEAVRDPVIAGIRAGQTLDQLKQSIRLERYAGWAGYQQMRELNIEGMHRYFSLFRVPNP
ncbi:MAG: MBL fold metallo-hydrolase [Alphaproteobacteria bacterium]|nr:MBL fold metallo-hydrolase [Alphaproteobacteria bacterium]